MSIILIRHGETNENKHRVLQTPDAVLSEAGQEQAHKLGERLKTISVSALICSDYARTRQTAAHILKHHQHIHPIYTPSLRERSFGDLRGRSYDEIGENFFDPLYHPPNGESKSMFEQRIASAWQEVLLLSKKTQGNLVVVSHGLFCKGLVQHHLTLPHDTQLPKKWHNTSVTAFTATPPYLISELNCDKHI